MIEKLKQCERRFLLEYPEGFEDKGLKLKHNFNKMAVLTQEALGQENFEDVDIILDHLVTIVSKSSLVSRFEKPLYKAFIEALSDLEKEILVKGYEMLLYGNEALGFNQVLEVYQNHKIAKWPIMSIVSVYFKPNEEVFIKPTTVKHILKYFRVEDLKYNAKPSYEFYVGFRQWLNQMKGHVSPCLSPSNAAFSGFLMMAMEIPDD